MKTLNETIKAVLDDVKDSQINLSSDTARGQLARLISAVLLAGDVKNEVNDDNGV